jgi:hypothetical protein
MGMCWRERAARPDAGNPAACDSQDFGTSRWQLVIEPYTNFPCVREGRDGPTAATRFREAPVVAGSAAVGDPGCARPDMEPAGMKRSIRKFIAAPVAAAGGFKAAARQRWRQRAPAADANLTTTFAKRLHLVHLNVRISCPGLLGSMQTSFIAAWQIEHVGFRIASEDGVTSGDRFSMTITPRE